MKEDGVVYGVNAGKKLFIREGITGNNPTGTRWREVLAPSFIHVSAGSSKLFGLDTNEFIFLFNSESML